MSFCIKGIGTAVPPFAISQEDAAQTAASFCDLDERQRRLLPVLYRQASVRKRHSVVLDGGKPEQGDGGAPQSFYQHVDSAAPLGPTTGERMQVYAAHATEIATEACRRALLAAGVRADEITHLVTVSCSGFAAPGVDVQLVRTLGLPAGTARTHVGFMGCHGALNGLRVAGAFLEADPAAYVLLCAIELCTLHHQYGWNPEQIVANALFADGAAAAVCTSRCAATETEPVLEVLASNSTIVPNTEDLMSWRIDDHGFQMGLSPRVPEVIRTSLRSWMAGWLAERELAIEAVGEWAIHPGGPRILQACLESLDLPATAIATSKGVLADYGNMSSPTILFIVERLWRQSSPGPWVLLAFGPGLTIEAALVEPHLSRVQLSADIAETESPTVGVS